MSAWRRWFARRRLLLVIVPLAVVTAVAFVLRTEARRVGKSGDGRLVEWSGQPAAPHLGVAFLGALPECAEDASFGDWASRALAAYGHERGAVFTAADVTDVGRYAPLLGLRAQASCFSGRTSEDAVGWYMFDRAGKLLARGVGASEPTVGVPRDVVVAGSQAQTYIQERIGSGQPFAGAVLGGRVVGKLARRLVVVDFPGWVVEGAGSARADTVRQALSLATLDIPWEAAFLPRRVPAGFDACAVRRVLPGLAGGAAYRVTAFCNEKGAELLVGLIEPASDAVSSESTLTVAGRRYRSYEAGGRRGVRSTPQGGATRFHWVEGPADMPLDDLRRVLDSLPIVESMWSG